MYHWKNILLRTLIISSFIAAPMVLVNKAGAEPITLGIKKAVKKVKKVAKKAARKAFGIGAEVGVDVGVSEAVSAAQQRRKTEAEAARVANTAARAQQAKSKEAFQQRLRTSLAQKGQNQPFGQSPAFRQALPRR